MADITYQKPQFRTQDIFRTITVAFQPYIPFSQAYRMKLMGGEAMLANKMTSGRGTSGYFHWAPQDEPSATNTREQLGNYPWFVRRMAYAGEGMGRLAAMSVNPIREKKVLEKVDGIQGEGSAQMLGEELRVLLDTNEAFEEVRTEAAYTFTERTSRDPLELELREVVDIMGKEMQSEGVNFKDTDFFDTGRDPFTEKMVTPGERLEAGKLGGFDIDLSKLEKTGGFKEFLLDSKEEGGMNLKSAFASAKGEILNLDNTHSLEISKAVAKRDRPSKLLTGFNAGKLSGDNLLQGWIGHLDKNITQWNAELKRTWDQLMKDTPWEGENDWASNKETYEAFYRLREAIQTPKMYAEGKSWQFKADKDMNRSEWMEKKTHAALREMAHRMMIDAYMGFLGGSIERTSHLWSAPLGDNLGMTLFWPKFDKIYEGKAISTPIEGEGGGMKDRIDVGLYTDYPVPQIGWSSQYVVLLPINKGNIALAYAIWAQGKSVMDETRRQELYEIAKGHALDESTATKERLRLASEGAMMNVERDIGLSVKWIETRMIQPTNMAKALHDQIRDYYESGERRQEAQNWYTNLMEESNKLTRQWFDVQEMGRGPVVGTPNLEGTTRSSEYVVGDELGNPRKHYLGVWSDRMKDTWEGVELGSKDAVGYNFAIAPFVTSRRAGTALFGGKNTKKSAYF